MSYHKPITVMSLQDVQDREAAAGNKDYANAVGRYPHLTDGADLSQVPADLVLVKQKLPLHGFDPALSKSEKAYKATRRKIIAAVKNASGEAEAARERRARVDEWAELLLALEPHAVTSGEQNHSAKQVLIPVRKLADVARTSDIKPSGVSQDLLDSISPMLETNEWKTLQRALKTLNRLRHDKNVCRFLPVAPFPAPNPRRQENLHLIPSRIANEIDDWVRNATLTEFDPVEQEYVDTASVSNVNFKLAAMRKFVSTLFRSGRLQPQTNLGLRDLMTPEYAADAVRFWSQHEDQKGHISARTAYDYLKSNYVVMARNGVDPSLMKSHLKANRFLKNGKRASNDMSPTSRKFCEHLLASSQQTMKFLSMHVHLRNQANELLDQLTGNVIILKSQEITLIRQIGTVAALCALETRGAPIRIESALELVLRGPDRTFHLPSRKTRHATIDLGPEHTKNNVEIWAPIQPNNLNGLEVIFWYLEKIRPLFPNHKNSIHLFPGFKCGEALEYRTFLGWFKRQTRSAGLPMTPHKFRHGLASLLLQHNPGRWDLLERLLDDTPATVRKNYAWVNERAKRTEVQKFILDLSSLSQ
ncbi:site-specific integrase [Tritonibacter mobilis]|uniref:site-specific integrase n=1 Tax=Tritonibacter mobilis TaxID=379347 RepID=UPI001CDA1292|nr:site-specific integrase [Tritonibacter mobilis]MCA2008630.1 site-specific integrase [Tritonibacter mobilis]